MNAAQRGPEEQLAILPDGRRLAYLDLGAPDGPPMIHLHGAPSGKLEARFFDLDAAATRAGVRLLAVDRPGVGGSDPLPGRRLLDWPADVAGLADGLGIATFAVLGYSMGAPSALACRERLEGRLTAVAIVSGLGPPDEPALDTGRSPDVARILRLARHRPLATTALLQVMRQGTRMPQRMLDSAARGAPPADQQVADRPGAPRQFAGFLADALRQGTTGVRTDLHLAASPWGFVPSPRAAPVTIWHGSADRNVPVAAASWLAERLPDAQLQLFPDEGHLSVLTRHAEQILTALRP